MVHWLMITLVYDLTILKLSLGEVTLALRLLHYKNSHGMTYDNHACDTRVEHDLNRDGRCDTAFLFCLVRLPFQNPHNCTLGDYFTGVVGADDIHFINIDEQSQIDVQQRSSALVSVWYQPTVYFRFKYPKTGIGMIVEVYDVDDLHNHTIHDSIDFYGRTLLDLKISPSKDAASKQRVYLRSLFGSYTNLTIDLSLYCSANYYGKDCETFCLTNEHRYDCDLNTGQKICKQGYFGAECLDDVRVCDDHSCLNNGTCVVYLGGYLCRCQTGFSGRSCEISNQRILKCNQFNCIHGNCSNEGKCICHEGWTSDQCNQRISGCASQPCLNNATCEALVGIYPEYTYRCHCRIGYSGRNCEIEMSKPCERIACFHGRCVQTNIYNEICVCHENWTGHDCSQRVHFPPKNPMKTEVDDDYLSWLNANYGMIKAPPRFILPTTTIIQPEYKFTSCSSSPCLHNSTCIARSEQTFQCVCSPAFIGLYCEIERNPCDNSPCQHQSICLPQPNQTFRCICRAHYTGKFCEYPVPLDLPTIFKKCSRNCQNGGICLVDEFNKEQCICKASFTGLYCELTKKTCLNSSDPLCTDDPCLSYPCLSNGTCHSLSSSKNYTCSCPTDYTGRRCETTTHFQRTIANINSKIDLWPLAVVFGYVFSLALVFIIIWFIWYGLTIRPQTVLTYGENVNDRYQLNRLSVSNPIFYTNQEYHTPIAKTWSTSPTTISNLDQWTRTITH